LEELGIDYEHDPTMPRSAGALAANPSGKIPTLLIDGEAIADSTAILTYLADSHGQFTHPAGSLDRARQDAWTGKILDEVDGALWLGAKHSFVLPEDKRVPEVKLTAKWEFAAAQARFAEALQGPFLMGDMMTVPDFLLVHCLGWAKVAGFPPADERLSSYLSGVTERPAYQRAAKLP
ncbi:MAG: glutathione S-transferase family protein, partial [Pseudomonadota bacterium]